MSNIKLSSTRRKAGFFLSVFAALLINSAVLAQSGTVANHAVPIGKGPGVTGFGAAVPGTVGQPLLSTGPSTDPAFGPFPPLGAASASSLAINGCTLGTAVLCAAGNITSTTGMIASGFFGGINPNSTVTLVATTSGSPSGDTANVYGSTVNIGSNNNNGSVINLNGAPSGGGGVTLNMASAVNGLVAFNVFNSGGGKQTWIPGAGAGTTPGTIQFPVGNLTLATLTGTETLASKTLTSPVVNGAVSGTAMASAAQYLAGTATGAIIAPSVVYLGELAVSFSATPTFDFAAFNNAAITLTGNITTMNVANVLPGKAGTITFVQSGAGSFTTVFNSVFKFPSGAAPALTTGSTTAIDVLSYSCRSPTFCAASLLKDVR